MLFALSRLMFWIYRQIDQFQDWFYRIAERVEDRALKPQRDALRKAQVIQDRLRAERVKQFNKGEINV